MRRGAHRLSLLDRLRGWHWKTGTGQAPVRVRNWCRCPIS